MSKKGQKQRRKYIFAFLQLYACPYFVRPLAVTGQGGRRVRGYFSAVVLGGDFGGGGNVNNSDDKNPAQDRRPQGLRRGRDLGHQRERSVHQVRELHLSKHGSLVSEQVGALFSCSELRRNHVPIDESHPRRAASVKRTRNKDSPVSGASSASSASSCSSASPAAAVAAAAPAPASSRQNAGRLFRRGSRLRRLGLALGKKGGCGLCCRRGRKNVSLSWKNKPGQGRLIGNLLAFLFPPRRKIGIHWYIGKRAVF